MKKYLSLVLSVVLLLTLTLNATVVSAAGAAAVVCEEVTCEPGEQVTVNVTIANNPGFGYLELTPVYAPELTLVDATNGELIGDFTKANQYIWVSDADVTADGLLMTFTFQVAEDVALGDYEVGFVVRKCANYNEQIVEMSAVNGKVTVAKAGPTALDQFTYEMNDTGLTITGYIGDAAKVVIGDSYEIGGTAYAVTAIADEAFLENTVVTSVEIPGTVKTIGEYAFDYCENLAAVKLNEGVQVIGAFAFEGCALTEIVIPASVTSIGECAVYDCLDMTGAVVLCKDAEIGDYALGYYTNRRKETPIDGFVVKGFKDTVAETYATTEGFAFEEIVLKMAGASITLQHNLTVNYKVDKVFFEEYGFTAPYIVAQMNGSNVTLTDYTVEGAYYVFSFRNIAPNQMKDTITTTLYATCGGSEYATEAKDYSVAEYAYSMLTEYASAEYAELRTLLVDLLHYGAATQTYANYKTDALANADLTAEQLAWGTAAEPAMQTVLNTAYATVASPAAKWTGAGLNLKESVALRLMFTAESIEGLSVKIESGDDVWTIPASEFVAGEGNEYTAYFNGLHAGQMRQSVYLTVCNGETPVSNTACYSIESYAYEKQTSTDANLAALVKAMMKYGDSAYAYAN